MLSRIPRIQYARITDHMVKIGQTQLLTQHLAYQISHVPHFTTAFKHNPNFISTDVKNSYSNIMEKMEIAKNLSPIKALINDSIKEQEAEKSVPAKKITSAKMLQEEVFKIAREYAQINRGTLFAFNLIENTLKKTSMHLFDGLYTLFADKEGIPEHKAKYILNLAIVLVLSILAFALKQEYEKKINEAKKLDDTLCTLYTKAEAIYKNANNLAGEITQLAAECGKLEKNIDLNNKILSLLDECAKSDNDPSGLLHSFKIFLQDQMASIADNKEIIQAKEENKIVRELRRRETSDPLATMAIGKVKSKGIAGTVNNIQAKNTDFQEEKESLKVSIDKKKEEKETKLQDIDVIIKKAEGLAMEAESMLVVKVGIFKPEYRDRKNTDPKQNVDISDITNICPNK